MHRLPRQAVHFFWKKVNPFPYHDKIEKAREICQKTKNISFCKLHRIANFGKTYGYNPFLG